jgi:hypothetical protein
MEGSKLELLKASLLYMVDQLKKTDRITIITFDSDVEVLIKMLYTTPENKERVKTAIRSIRAGSQTNLSGGLFEALQIFRKRTEVLDVSSVLVFTDGYANRGVTAPAMFSKGIENTLKDLPTCSIYTFGFGNEHDAALLRGISEAGNGMYYYISKEDEIPQHFGDCLGGLISMFAQNMKLELKTAENVTVKSVLSKYPQTHYEDQLRHVELKLGDMTSEERKDLLFVLTMAACTDNAEAYPLAGVVLSYFDVPQSAQKEKVGQFKIQRNTSITTPNNGAAATPSPIINRQRNRIETTKALEQAATLARAEKYEEARAVIVKAISFIEASFTAQDPFCLALIGDLKNTLSGLSDNVTYTTHGGTQYLHNMLHCQNRQRSTATWCSAATPQPSQQYYSTTIKSAQRTIANAYTTK